MLVFKEVMSSVIRWLSVGTSTASLISFRKSVVSFPYDLLCVEGGLRKWSTNLDIFSVGHPLIDTMGLSGGGVIPLFFGESRCLVFYILCLVSIQSLISPCVYRSVMKFCTYFLCLSVRLVSMDWQISEM